MERCTRKKYYFLYPQKSISESNVNIFQNIFKWIFNLKIKQKNKGEKILKQFAFNRVFFYHKCSIRYQFVIWAKSLILSVQIP